MSLPLSPPLFMHGSNSSSSVSAHLISPSAFFLVSPPIGLGVGSGSGASPMDMSMLESPPVPNVVIVEHAALPAQQTHALPYGSVLRFDAGFAASAAVGAFNFAAQTGQQQQQPRFIVDIDAPGSASMSSMRPTSSASVLPSASVSSSSSSSSLAAPSSPSVTVRLSIPHLHALEAQAQAQAQAQVLSSKVTAVPAFSFAPQRHSNPELLEGFSLDGGAVPALVLQEPPTQAKAAKGTAGGKRKRKASPTASASSSSSSAAGDDCVIIDVAAQEVAGPKKRQRKATLLLLQASKNGKSLMDVRSASSSSSSTTTQGSVSGHVSPLLELLQQGNQSASATSPLPHFVSATPAASATTTKAPPRSKEERAELRRHKAKMKLLRLEASIAQLQSELHSTRAAEAEATHRANSLAMQAMQAAQVAAAVEAQQQQQAQAQAHAQQQLHTQEPPNVMGLVESFFAEDAASSLPPLSPEHSLQHPRTLPSSMVPLRITVSSASSSSGSSLSDEGECFTPTRSEGSVSVRGHSHSHGHGSGSVGVASPVQSLDDAIEAALAADSYASAAGNPRAKASLEAHLRTLHWAEQARSLRTAQASLRAMEEDAEAWWDEEGDIAAAPHAIRFIEEQQQLQQQGAGSWVADSTQLDATREALRLMRAECAAEEAAETAEMHQTLQELSQAFLAKSRAQQSAFTLCA